MINTSSPYNIPQPLQAPSLSSDQSKIMYTIPDEYSFLIVKRALFDKILKHKKEIVNYFDIIKNKLEPLKFDGDTNGKFDNTLVTELSKLNEIIKEYEQTKNVYKDLDMGGKL